MLVIMTVSLYTSRVVITALGEHDFGIYNVVGGTALLFGFFSSSLSNATQRFLSIFLAKSDISAAQRVFALSFWIFLGISFVVYVIAEAVGGWLLMDKLVIPNHREEVALWVFHLLSLSLLFTLNGIVFNSVLIARENFKIYAYLSIVEAILKLVVAVILTMSKTDRLLLYAVLYLCTTISIELLLAMYCMNKYPEAKITFFWDKGMFKQLFSFIGWNTFATAVWAVNNQGINILMNMFFGVSINAARGISTQAEQPLYNVNAGFMTAVKPQMIKSYGVGDYSRCINLLFKSSRFSFYLMLLVAIPIAIERENLLNFWLDTYPDYASSFLFWGILFALIESIVNPIWITMQGVGELTKFSVWGGSVFLLVFPISYLVLLVSPVPVYPLIVLCLIRGLYIYTTLRILKRYIYFSLGEYTKKVVLPIIRVFLIAFLIGIIVKSLSLDESNFINLLFSILILVCTTFLSVFIFGLDKLEREVLYTKIKWLLSYLIGKR